MLQQTTMIYSVSSTLKKAAMANLPPQTGALLQLNAVVAWWSGG